MKNTVTISLERHKELEQIEEDYTKDTIKCSILEGTYGQFGIPYYKDCYYTKDEALTKLGDENNRLDDEIKRIQKELDNINESIEKSLNDNLSKIENSITKGWDLYHMTYWELKRWKKKWKYSKLK